MHKVELPIDYRQDTLDQAYEPYAHNRREFKYFKEFDKAILEAQSNEKEKLQKNINFAARIALQLNSTSGIKHVVHRIISVSKDPKSRKETAVYAMDSIMRHSSSDEELTHRYQKHLQPHLYNIFKRALSKQETRMSIAEKLLFKILTKWRQKEWFDKDLDMLDKLIHTYAPGIDARAPPPKAARGAPDETHDIAVDGGADGVSDAKMGLPVAGATAKAGAPPTPAQPGFLMAPGTPVVLAKAAAAAAAAGFSPAPGSSYATAAAAAAAAQMQPMKFEQVALPKTGGIIGTMEVLMQVPGTPRGPDAAPGTPAAPGMRIPSTPTGAFSQLPQKGAIPSTPVAAFGQIPSTPKASFSQIPSQIPGTPAEALRAGPSPFTPRPGFAAPFTPRPLAPPAPFALGASQAPQPFTPAPGGSAQPFTPAPGGVAQPFTPAPGGLAQPFTPAPGALAQPFTPAPGGVAQPFTPAPGGSAQPFTPAGPQAMPMTPAGAFPQPFTPRPPKAAAVTKPVPATPAAITGHVQVQPSTPASPGAIASGAPHTPGVFQPYTPASPAGGVPGTPGFQPFTPASPGYGAPGTPGVSAPFTPAAAPGTPGYSPSYGRYQPVAGGDAAPMTPAFAGAVKRAPGTPGLEAAPGTPAVGSGANFRPVAGGEAAPMTPGFLMQSKPLGVKEDQPPQKEDQADSKGIDNLGDDKSAHSRSDAGGGEGVGSPALAPAAAAASLAPAKTELATPRKGGGVKEEVEEAVPQTLSPAQEPESSVLPPTEGEATPWTEAMQGEATPLVMVATVPGSITPGIELEAPPAIYGSHTESSLPTTLPGSEVPSEMGHPSAVALRPPDVSESDATMLPEDTASIKRARSPPEEAHGGGDEDESSRPASKRPRGNVDAAAMEEEDAASERPLEVPPTEPTLPPTDLIEEPVDDEVPGKLHHRQGPPPSQPTLLPPTEEEDQELLPDFPRSQTPLASSALAPSTTNATEDFPTVLDMVVGAGGTRTPNSQEGIPAAPRPDTPHSAPGSNQGREAALPTQT